MQTQLGEGKNEYFEQALKRIDESMDGCFMKSMTSSVLYCHLPIVLNHLNLEAGSFTVEAIDKEQGADTVKPVSL